MKIFFNMENLLSLCNKNQGCKHSSSGYPSFRLENRTWNFFKKLVFLSQFILIFINIEGCQKKKSDSSVDSSSQFESTEQISAETQPFVIVSMESEITSSPRESVKVNKGQTLQFKVSTSRMGSVIKAGGNCPEGTWLGELYETAPIFDDCSIHFTFNQSIPENTPVPLGWYQESFLKASNANAADYFGSAVAISGDTVIVGAYGESSAETIILGGSTASKNNGATAAGASYIYKRTGSAWTGDAYVKASNANSNDNFGYAVAISGDTAIVGAYQEDSNQTFITNGTTSSTAHSELEAGASYIFRRTGSLWSQEAYLKASNSHAGDFFGHTVAISEDTAIVGAPSENSAQTMITNGTTSSNATTSADAGASYIYKRSGTTWIQEAYLKASNANANDNFGYAVTISGDTAIVGAYHEDSNQTVITNGEASSTDQNALDAGSSYIYKRTGSFWAQEAYIKASNANSSDYFGTSVSLSGDTAMIGAPGENSGQTTITNGTSSSSDETFFSSGAAYIYQRSGTAWVQQAYLKASNTHPSDLFGSTVSLSGNTAIVGARGQDSSETTITNGLITNGSGSSSDTAALGAGAGYIYKRTGAIWVQEAYLKASNAEAYDLFGTSVAISGDTVIVGAIGESSNQSVITNSQVSSADNSMPSAGAAYIFRNRTRMFDPTLVSSKTTSTSKSFSVSWDGSHLGNTFSFKVVYSINLPEPKCGSGQVAYTGSESAATITSGLTPGQTYVVRICSFDGTNYSEGITTAVTVKADDLGPQVLSIRRGITPNPVPTATNLIDYIVTFDEPVTGLRPENFTLTEVLSASGASGQISRINCNAAVCTVWAIPNKAGRLRLDLTTGEGVVDRWDNQMDTIKVGDEYFTLTGWVQEAYIKSSNAENYEFFGTNISISGDTAIVGVTREDSNQTTITNGSSSSTDNSSTSAGASYIFKRSGVTWIQEAYLKASNANTLDFFGESVSISGDAAIVGAFYEDSGQTTITNSSVSSSDNSSYDAGSSYIYRRTNSQWVLEAYIKASNAYQQDYFGSSVAISGDTAIVGSIGQASNQTTITNGTTSSFDKIAEGSGASYIYKRTGTIWAQEAFIKTSKSNPHGFGHDVSISGDTVVVGAPSDGSSAQTITNGTTSNHDNSAIFSGASYIYRRTGSSWAQEAYIKASNANSYDFFGASVAITGDTVIIGAFGESSNQTHISNFEPGSSDNSSSQAGAAYIFRRSGSLWSEVAYLKAFNNDHSYYNEFGSAVSISGNTAIIGAPQEASNQTSISNGTISTNIYNAGSSGAGYIFNGVSSLWIHEAYLKASNSNAADNFGTSVSISGDTAVVGAHEEDSNQTVITNGASSSTDNTAACSGAVYVFRNLGRIFDPELRISEKTATSITLSWSNNLGAANQVKIAPAVAESQNPPPCTDPSSITLASGVTTYTYSGLQSGKKYGFRVCGFDGTEVSEGAIIRDDTN